MREYIWRVICRVMAVIVAGVMLTTTWFLMRAAESAAMHGLMEIQRGFYALTVLSIVLSAGVVGSLWGLSARTC